MIPEIIKAPAGIGKTQLTAIQVAESKNFPIEIYTPTHALGSEWQISLLKKNPALKVVHIHGRSHIGADGITLCKKADIAQALSKAGSSVYPNLCLRQQGVGQPPLICEHYKDCKYTAQFKSADVYIFPHSYITQSRSKLENWIPHTAIIDESFFQQFIEKVTFPVTLLISQHIPEQASCLCRKVYEIIISGDIAYQIINNAEIDGLLRKAIQSLQKLKFDLHPELSEEQLAANIQNITSLQPIVILLETLRADRKGQAVQYNTITSEITVHHKKRMTRFDDTVQIKCIDASASKIISEALFGQVIFKPISALRNANVTQCYSTRCSTTSLVPEKNSSEKSAKYAEKRLNDINHLIKTKSMNGTKVLVIGPQAIVGNPVNAIPPKIDIPSHCDSCHFNGFRGIDRWKDFDVVIVIGRNEPSVAAVEDMARAIFTWEYGPLNLTGEWTTEQRGYHMKGERHGVEVVVHPDTRIQALVEQLREAETLQAIDRLRLMHNFETKDVIILSNIPLDIDVNELRNWDDIIYGSRLERAIALNNGILPLAPEWLSLNHSDLWKTQNAAKCDVKRELKNFKKGQIANSNIIRKMTLFKYKVPHQRSWSWCLSCVNDIALVTARLEILIASVVDVQSVVLPSASA